MYPFNPRAVLNHDPCNEVLITDKITERSLGDSTGEISQLEEASNSTIIVFSFTPEENDKYNTRFTEGYNLYDRKYVAWLKANHPEEDCSNFLPLAEMQYHLMCYLFQIQVLRYPVSVVSVSV